MKENNSPYLTRKEAAEMLGVTERTVDRYAAAGSLTVYRLPPTNRFTRFSRTEVEALLIPVKN